MRKKVNPHPFCVSGMVAIIQCPAVFQIDELNSKLMSKTEELMDRQTKWMEATEALRKKEDEVKKMENQYGID